MSKKLEELLNLPEHREAMKEVEKDLFKEIENRLMLRALLERRKAEDFANSNFVKNDIYLLLLGKGIFFLIFGIGNL
jgi:hypothetical protein